MATSPLTPAPTPADGPACQYVDTKPVLRFTATPASTLPPRPICGSAVEALTETVSTIPFWHLGSLGSSHNPKGSVYVTGFPPAYAYRFVPPASPIGSCVR